MRVVRIPLSVIAAHFSLEMPKHLVVLTHGLAGSPDELYFIQKTLIKHYEAEPDLVFKIPCCNHRRTSDGIMNGAARLFEWIRKQTSECKYDRISFISHSLGGIYARCAAKLLYDNGLIPSKLKPVNFITLATPHLGSQQHVYLYHSIHAFIVSKFIGQTVLELTMTDSQDPKTTLMNRLCHKDYLIPLEMFDKLVAYSNVDSDFTVNYKTGGIHTSKFRHDDNLTFESNELPVIVKDERLVEERTGESCIEHEMCQALDKLPWIRFAVFPKRAMKAHTDIIVRNELTDAKYGQKVVEHVTNQFSNPK